MVRRALHPDRGQEFDRVVGHARRYAADMEGAVSAWRRGAPQPAMVRPPETLSTCPVT